MEKTAYQEIIDKIHFYMENPHLNPLDVDYTKPCSICREEFKPTNKSAETRQCCKQCIEIFKEN